MQHGRREPQSESFGYGRGRGWGHRPWPDAVLGRLSCLRGALGRLRRRGQREPFDWSGVLVRL